MNLAAEKKSSVHKVYKQENTRCKRKARIRGTYAWSRKRWRWRNKSLVTRSSGIIVEGLKFWGRPPWNFKQGSVVRYVSHKHYFSYSLENGLNRVRWIQENHEVLTVLIKVKSDECLK